MKGVQSLSELVGLLDLAPDPILLVDARGIIRLANHAVVDLFGWTPEELQGQPVEVLIPVALRAVHGAHRERFTGDPHVRPMGSLKGLVALHQDGRELPVDIRLNPTLVGDERMVTAVIRDIGHLRAHQEEIARYARDLEQLNAALQDSVEQVSRQNQALREAVAQRSLVLGVAAHDLRNPLAAVRGFAELLHDGLLGALDPRQTTFVDRIVRSTDYMLELVDDLVDLSAIESGQLRLDLEPADLSAITAEALQVERVVADRKGLALSFEEEPVPVMVDRRKIEQVVHNLVGNALKYSPVGSSVNVRVVCGAGTGELSVADHGPGISSHVIARLFQPFQRGEARSTAGEPSTGLGLAIARRIVEGHGGRIDVESALGQGSTFRVRLPLA